MTTVWYPQIALYSTAAAAIPYSTIKRIAEACQQQLYYDYRPHWGNFGYVTPFRNASEVPRPKYGYQGYWPCTIMTSAEGGGPFGGDHSYSMGSGGVNRPDMRVDSRWVDANNGRMVSHEILEAMGNPFWDNIYERWIYSPRPDGPYHNTWHRTRYQNEIADPVYNWGYNKTISSANGGGVVDVSNFITPYWWDVNTQYYGYPYPYDFMNRLRQGGTSPLRFSWWGDPSNYWAQVGFAWW